MTICVLILASNIDMNRTWQWVPVTYLLYSVQWSWSMAWFSIILSSVISTVSNRPRYSYSTWTIQQRYHSNIQHHQLRQLHFHYRDLDQNYRKNFKLKDFYHSGELFGSCCCPWTTCLPAVSETISQRRLCMLGHMSRMPPSADAYKAIYQDISSDRRRRPGRPR